MVVFQSLVLLFSKVKMVVIYQVTFFSGDATHFSTFNDVFLTLVGTESSSERTKLSRFFKEKMLIFDVICPEPIGQILVIKLEKLHHLLLNQPWFLAKVKLKSDEGKFYHFPVYQWITDYKEHCFREGKAALNFDDSNSLLKNYRKHELEERQKVYCWDQYKKMLPYCMKAESFKSLPLDVRFSTTKEVEMGYTAAKALIELGIEELAECKTKWESMEDIDRLYRCHRTDISDYVHAHWKEDAFFGYQFLNGIHPMMIQRCETLPPNFPVSDQMVFSNSPLHLGDEMKNGNIFLCDYKILDGVKANIINKKQQYVVAPLVLLHKTPENQMMPIAIQLQQTPGKKNPIFFPTDSKWDWLLAKTFVRNADFNVHELSAHLLRTHFLAEDFAVAVLRNLPMVHPLYKLLIPHTRYTLMINFLARKLLISENGVFKKIASCGGKGMFSVLRRSISSVTYRSLCLPDNIADRGLEDVPNFYYRDDGLKLWNIIHRFVQGILVFYYKDDKMVQKDSELQAWIKDIFQKGFLGNKDTGVPEKLDTVDELVNFVTMVIFTCSAQHSAVNSGQYDFDGWMPNTPVSIDLPPPTTKGTADEAMLLRAFPHINTTVNGMATVWLLSKQSTDSVFLGNYPEELFTEDIPLQKKRAFKEDLMKLSEEINQRNEHLDLPYIYLDPKLVENSVSL
ncbi:polyunsaturated fatty acid lipoxygenase ALOX8 isoform X2 [Kryptolebias marmoratus]|uniref:polyunsaturated fatty acid lipoxygenase ALOX8 isoform X2 n=2 Tax=Kryptolebias marmoratus TaxID=37003 RepID=UPI0007F89E19|nr:polyunsaturated fatty acid lipoxygenase ALOX8 isoform X2 [Kryptolebias marmoratus]